MVSSVQPIQSNTANLNKVGFSSEKESSKSEQADIALETPKDEFIKKKSSPVKKGAIAGGLAGFALVCAGIPFCKKSTGKFPRLLTLGLVSAPFVAVGAAIGAGIGKIVKVFSKKD